MDAAVSFLSAYAPQRWSSTTLLVLGFLIFGLLETVRPARRAVSGDGRFVVNLALTVFNFTVLAAILPSGRAVAEKLSLPSLGLASRLADMPILAITLGLVLVDAIRYGVHVAFHVVPWLWRVHAVHHSDVEIDVTTGHRHHPIEYAVAGFVFGTAHVLLDIPVQALALYAAIYYLWTPFTHANLALPAGLDRMLRTVLVTPTFHAVHHVNTVADGHSNFGTVLSIWDRLLGTAREPSSAAASFGLIGEAPPRSRGLLDLLILPFAPQPVPLQEKAKGGD